MSLRFKFCIVMSVTISAWKRCSIRLNLELFVERLMSYLRYLCLFPYSGVQHILCCGFVLTFFVLCALWCQFLWIVNFWLPLRYYLTFIYCRSLHICKNYHINAKYMIKSVYHMFNHDWNNFKINEEFIIIHQNNKINNV